MDLSFYTIAELESLAAAALSGPAEVRAVVDAHETSDRVRAARASFLGYGDRPVGWDFSGNA